MNILRFPGVAVPDLHPALFDHGLDDLGTKAHGWASQIEQLVDDRVIWEGQFSAEFRLFVHAKFAGGKAWKKNLSTVQKRIGIG